MPGLKMSEGQLLESVRHLARTYGLLIYHTYDSRRSYTGFPDLVLVGAGGVLFRELKRDGEYPTAGQRNWINALAAVGVDVAVWREADWHSQRIHNEIKAAAGRGGGR